MLRNLASSLFLTERDAEHDPNKPKVKGRVVTTLPKAKEVRRLVEKCITLARRALPHEKNADEYATRAKRGTEEWRQWRSSDQWRRWCHARAPVVAARRAALQMLGDKQAVRILFEQIAPRFAKRPGGYTRVLKLAKPRLGDSGARAILEFVGVRDRKGTKAERPAFSEEKPSDREREASSEASKAKDTAEASAAPVSPLPSGEAETPG